MGDGNIYVQVIPPPPPTPYVYIATGSAAIGAGAGFAGFALVAGIFAAISAIAGITYLVKINGKYWIPPDALDGEGRLKNYKSGR